MAKSKNYLSKTKTNSIKELEFTIS